MSPEMQGLLTVAVSAIASGVTGALANTRAMRKQLRRLRRNQAGQAKALKRVEEAQGVQIARVGELEKARKADARRVSWLMGGVHALLKAFDIRPQSLAVAADAEATGAPAARRAGG
ncbi:hypothetical protein F0U59_26720 [Archangium gephyra]|nr:hypothetical protein F0U59_26720 [Archangium gephyra]